MEYISIKETAQKWGISERSVRAYCADGRVKGAVLEGKTWKIPQAALKPERKKRTVNNKKNLLEILKREKNARISGGIYHKIQIDLTYNSNHIEGSRLTHEQTRYIYETNTIGLEKQAVNIDDIIETANHFRCIDFIIETAEKPLSESLIKELHRILKSSTSDSRNDWFAVGDYKKLPNEVGGMPTSLPENVEREMKKLIAEYNGVKGKKSLTDIIEFHYRFEKIHPFQDGNGRVGRLIMFKECLKNGVVPFIIGDDLKMFYYRGLAMWEREQGYLADTCLTAQDRFREVLRYFGI